MATAASSKKKNLTRTTATGKKSGGKKNRKNSNGDQPSALRSFLRVLLLAIVLVIVFIFVYVVAFVHSDASISLEDYKSAQAQTSIIYGKESADSEEYVQIASLHGEQNRVWVSLDKIPEDLQNAFVCLEDKRFEKHNGVDWIRTFKAAITLGKSGGGSTLTQQLIKNLTDENQVTISRKLKEILYALNLENNYSKDEILEAYLNTIPLGSGCYGVQTAAEKYFGKDLSELNTAECAVLASITKAPTAYNPLLNPDNNKKRQETCLKAMKKEGAITSDQYEEAVNYHLVFTNSSDYEGGDEDTTEDNTVTEINSYYVDYVIDTVIKDLMSQYNYSKSEATQKVYNGGLRIYTTEIQSVQDAAEYVYENRVTFPNESNRTETGDNNTKKRVQAACTIMDYEGNVVAMVGGAGTKTINRGFNRATDATRSPGSSIKPLSAYAPAMEEGKITYSSSVKNEALTINGKEWPQNFDGSYGSPNATVTVQYAVAQSLNTCAAQIVYDLGTDTSMKYLIDKFHISTLITEGVNTDSNMSSMAVGGMSQGVTTLEMAAAYATFGNGGEYYTPRCYTKITDYTGEKTLLETKEEHEQALSSATAGVMNHIMQTVVTEGTARGCGVTGFTSFMKTGTTSDTKDKWACGGTPYYVAAVWYGYDEQEEITNVGTSNPAARIWSAVMNRALKGYDKKNFDYGDDVVEKAYCTKTGLLAGSNCPRSTGFYDKNNLPETCDGTHTSVIDNSDATATSGDDSTTGDDKSKTEDNSSSATTNSTTQSTTASTTNSTVPRSSAPEVAAIVRLH